jgi:hypothetical protein
MSTMRLGLSMIVVSLLPLLSLQPAAVATTPDQTAILTQIRQHTETADFRATGRLVRVAANGERTNYKLGMKGHWFPDGLRLLYEMTGPDAARTRLLLHMTATGTTTVEIVQPGTSTPTALGPEHWRDGVLGTDFSYEDLIEGQFFWKNQDFLAPAKYGARDCFVLKSVPSSEDRSQYGSVTSWIDRQIFYPVHVTKAVRGTGEQKDFTYFGLRQTSGVWSASQLEVMVQGRPGSSLLLIERGSPKAKLTRKDFDLHQPLTQGKR